MVTGCGGGGGSAGGNRAGGRHGEVDRSRKMGSGFFGFGLLLLFLASTPNTLVSADTLGSGVQME